MSYAQAQKFQSRERNNGRNVQVLVFAASLSKEKGKTASFTGDHWSLCEGTSSHAGGISYIILISMIWAWSRTNEHQSLRALIKQTHSKNTDATWCNIKCSNCSELRFGSVFCVIFLQQKLTYYYILNVTQNFASIEMRPPRFLGKSQSFDILSISGISKIFKNHGISWLSIERVLHNRQAHLLGLTTECTTWCKVNWLLNTFDTFEHWEILRDIERLEFRWVQAALCFPIFPKGHMPVLNSLRVCMSP